MVYKSMCSLLNIIQIAMFVVAIIIIVANLDTMVIGLGLGLCYMFSFATDGVEELCKNAYDLYGYNPPMFNHGS